MQWNLRDFQFSFADRQQFIQKFETVDINLSDQMNAAPEVHGDEATHVITEMAVAVGKAPSRQLVRHVGPPCSAFTEAMDLRVHQEAAADHKISILMKLLNLKRKSKNINLLKKLKKNVNLN